MKPQSIPLPRFIAMHQALSFRARDEAAFFRGLRRLRAWAVCRNYL